MLRLPMHFVWRCAGLNPPLGGGHLTTPTTLIETKAGKLPRFLSTSPQVRSRNGLLSHKHFSKHVRYVYDENAVGVECNLHKIRQTRH